MTLLSRYTLMFADVHSSGASAAFDMENWYGVKDVEKMPRSPFAPLMTGVAVRSYQFGIRRAAAGNSYAVADAVACRRHHGGIKRIGSL
jgi:hypothetical protein